MPGPPPRETTADMQDDMTALHTTPYHMSYTYLCLLSQTVFLVLLLTVVIRQTVLYLHREGRTLTSAGSIPSWGGGPSYSFSLVGQLSPLRLLYLTVIHCGAGRRMSSLCNLYRNIVLLTFLVVIGARLHQSCPGACRSSEKSATGSLILCRK